MSKERGFLEYGRRDPGYRPREERVKDFKSVELRLADEEIHQQVARCMDCGTPFCHGYGCPLNNIIPEFNDHVYHQRWKEALDLLLSTSPFPEVTGRVCPALCEGSCVLGIHSEPVTIRQIELAVVEKGFERGYIVPQPPKTRRAERVAIVGAGPAGLSAADLLNRAGFPVVVYEAAAKPGGVLRYGIPDFKLEKWILDRRIQLMKDEGIVFETGVQVGTDLSYRFLKGHYDAVVLTGGARESRDLKVPGRELKGIHFAMQFLVQQNQRTGGEPIEGEEITARDKQVVIIGGGDTGSDCLGTAVRQGAKRVHQFEILPKPPPTRAVNTPWPMWPNMLRESSSHKEGGERRWCVSTKEFVGENGHVRRLKGIEVEWVAKPGGGAPAPQEKPGTDFTVDADLVLLAMGFSGPGKNQLIPDLGLEVDRNGFVRRHDDNMTSVPGVFVAGDMTQGASLVVRAISDGREAAQGVIAYLSARRPPNGPDSK